MTRKDYELIARAIEATVRNPGASSDPIELAQFRQAENIVRSLARALAMDNPRFDMPRFLAACGVL